MEDILPPPRFDSQVLVYEKCKIKFNLWQTVTDANKRKQCVLLVLCLDEGTQDSLFDLVTHEEIIADDGLETVLDKLDGIFDVDPSIAAYQDFHASEDFVLQ